MKTWAGLIFCFLFSAGSLNAEPTTVPSVDLQRYLGKWYEIGTIPQSFQKGCQCVTAEYSLREDGQIGVINSCRKDAPTGKLKLAKGRAKIEDKVSNAKLRVTFFWPFYGDYWIIGLDANYRYALVSDRKGKTLWLLSRTPVLDQDLFEEALARAKDQGIDLNRFELTNQTDCERPQ